MKFSVVTISFNQAEFLERTILSVIGQTGVELEYIIVDPGSTDGSRDIIESYKDHFTHIIYERDDGPADGLNKGFARASGDVYCYLNSDDTFEAGALNRVERYLKSHPDVDVACGHGWATDRNNVYLRKVWSEPYQRLMVAYGAAVQIQPSTFIRREAFRRSGGFNVDNRSNWDGELLIDLFLNNFCIAVIDEFVSCYRLHDVSITNSGKLDRLIEAFGQRRFFRLMGRPFGPFDRPVGVVLRIYKHVRRPVALLERLRSGPLYKRGIC